MFTVTDVHEIIHKKITRNNVLKEIFILYEELLDHEILLKRNVQEFYQKQQTDVSIMNAIELLQTREYTLERQDSVNTIMETIGIFTPSSSLLEIKAKIKEIKNMINEKVIVMNNIQSLIPIEGIATNYKVIVQDTTCSTSTR
jgi:hypothetical protein